MSEQEPNQLGDSPNFDETPLPPELRRQLLQDIEEGKMSDDDPFAAIDGLDTMQPQGDIPQYATPIGDAPEGAMGSMQHMISSQLEHLKGTKHRGVYFKDEDPGDPERVIKAKGEKKIVPLMQNATVAFCDLATEDGRKKYEEVMDLIASSLGTYQLFDQEKDPHIEIGPDGQPHAIVILKYCKVTKMISVKQPKYVEISEESMKKKFFPNYEEVDAPKDPEVSGSDSGETDPATAPAAADPEAFPEVSGTTESQNEEPES